MKKPSKKGMKTLTPKDREELADHVRACIMAAEASACTQVALDRLAEMAAATGDVDALSRLADEGSSVAVTVLSRIIDESE